MIGAFRADSGTGAVYVYGRDASGNWKMELRMSPPGPLTGRNSGFGSAIVLRGYDFAALHTRFNSNEYGAITWTILTVHLAHLLAATLESSLVAGMLFGAPEEKVSYDDVTAMAVYWYLIAFSWILFYVIVFISPRFRFV
jgi:hypothetical protein